MLYDAPYYKIFKITNLFYSFFFLESGSVFVIIIMDQIQILLVRTFPADLDPVKCFESEGIWTCNTILKA